MTKKKCKLKEMKIDSACRGFLDMDYLDKIDNMKEGPEKEEALKFMRSFIDEAGNGSYPENRETVHNTPELKKQCEDNRDARRRDILNVSKKVIDNHYKDRKYKNSYNHTDYNFEKPETKDET